MTKQLAQLRTFETGRLVIRHLEIAADLWTQTRGLMGRAEMAKEGGLYIPNCNAIHTAFVRFPIDVMFLDKELNVVRLIEGLPPWRIVGFVKGAKSVIELPAGTLRQKQIIVGQQFALHLTAPNLSDGRT